MKLHTPLQAAASWQVHSRNLRAYEQIAVSERGESLSRISWANVVYRLSNHISSRGGGVGKVVAIAMMLPVMGSGVTATSQQQYKILITSEQ